MLAGKKIILGVTGSIAAYKIPILVRLLVKNGAEVKVIMTPSAAGFVSSLVLSTLSKNPVLSLLADEETWANHVMLGRWADVMMIAPLSCNTAGKMASGQCDNLLLATYFSATCPVIVAPAMDEDMWHHPATKRALAAMTQDGCSVIPVAWGELASGLVGDGRMAEPETLLNFLVTYFKESGRFTNKKVLITAGPTYEAIDPVRFISNHSSGKMGYALADELARRGAMVTLISGPVSLKPSVQGVAVIPVTSAKEMLEACVQHTNYDVAIMAAAVADYTPAYPSTQKIKKSEDVLVVELKKTDDILAFFGKQKGEAQLLVGFALETRNERENAIKKLHTKNADLIVLNSLNDKGAGFGKETNRITLFFKTGEEKKFETKSKEAVALDIVDAISPLIKQ